MFSKAHLSPTFAIGVLHTIQISLGYALTHSPIKDVAVVVIFKLILQIDMSITREIAFL